MMVLTALVLAILFIVLATVRLKLHPAIALLLAAFGFGAGSGMQGPELIDTVIAGFGGTIGQIGIVIMAGALIGVFLERSGGALKLAEAVLRRTGEKQVPATMAGIGYIVSIPVFCDTAFIILSSLNKALSRRAGTTAAVGATALALGLYATHTLVPPTPGPLAAAGLLGADLGLVILWGGLVALVGAVTGWLFAITMAAKVETAAEDVPDEPALISSTQEPVVAGPGAFHSALPIILPLLLILLRSVVTLPSRPLGEGSLVYAMEVIGHPIIALGVGVALALTLPRRFERSMLSAEGWTGEALATSATIILITGAGGAFGRVLQASDIANIVGASVQSANLGIFLPFLVAAAIKTAQGSSTVAMLTAAGLTAPLLAVLGLDSPNGTALATVAIGAGAMVVSHANDSYFWVVTQFSGMSVRAGYRLLTLGTLVEGLVCAVAVWLLSLALL